MREEQGKQEEREWRDWVEQMQVHMQRQVEQELQEVRKGLSAHVTITAAAQSTSDAAHTTPV